MNYEIEVTTFAPRLAAHQFETADPVKAASYLDEQLESICCVVVAASESEVDLGNFILWLSGERALVRLDEHREHFASSPNIDGRNSPIVFRDDDGSSFSVAVERTVARQDAVAALRFWLSSQARTASLNWD